MKLSSRRQLLKEAEEELGKMKDESTLNESETNFLVDRLRADTGNYKRFDKRHSDMINADEKKISVPITAKVPVSLYYDIEHEEVRYHISEDTGTNYPILEKEVMKNPQFKTEMKRYSDMAKTFMKDCQTWIRDTAKKHNISISRQDTERIMWNLF